MNILKAIFLILVSLDCLLASEVSLQKLEEAQRMINNNRPGFRGRINIIDGLSNEVPSLQKLIINTSQEDRECCIITYASYNKKYHFLLEQLIARLKQTFRGHLLYRIGGWPNMEAGCLGHCDVPYAFKVCAFKEALELGYKKVLWLDALVEPLQDLTPVFDRIEKQTCTYRYSFYPFKDYVTQEILDDFQLTFEEVKNYSHIAGGILGFNFKSKIAVTFLNEWHDSVERKKSFYTNFAEMLPLSILLHKYHLDDCAFGPNLATFSANGNVPFFFRINYERK